MKKNPGRKQARYDNFHGNQQQMHGKPQTYVAIGVMKPILEIKASVMTTKRKEMLKKYPKRMLESEKLILEKEKQSGQEKS